MEVDFFSFKYAPTELRQKWLDCATQIISNGVFIGGQTVIEFEKAWAKFTSSKYAIGVSNGLDGLTLSLRSLDIKFGDYVAVPAHTFIATWNAVISVGAIPIGIDVDRNGLLDLEEFSRIARKVKAVIPVHMHGASVDMAKLSEICSKVEHNKISIVEDAAQAHGSRAPDGSNLGKYSDLVVYSLYPTKNMGALGDAAVITTNNESLSDRLRSLRSYGQSRESKYIHTELGYNNRLDPIQAAILMTNLTYLPDWNKTRQELSNYYISQLSSFIEILQVSRTESVRHHFCVLTPERDDLRKFLLSKGVQTEIHYPKVAGIEAMSFIGMNSYFPVSEKIAQETLSLPISQWHNLEQIDYVASQVKQWCKS